jgi:hypothetical protein
MLRTFLFCASLAAALLLAPARAWAEDRPAADRPSESQKKKEAADDWRLGPVVGLGFPRPFAIEGLLKIKNVVGLGVEYSFLPKTTISDITTRFDAIALDANWYPFKGGFFIGARAGRQWLSGSATLRVLNFGSFTESADATAWFVNPRIGYLYTWSSGFTLGFDAGVQLPIGATYERSGPATAAGLSDPNVDRSLRQVAKTLGNDVTPTVDLFRVGFLF